jgi:hypothetical protein
MFLILFDLAKQQPFVSLCLTFEEAEAVAKT